MGNTLSENTLSNKKYPTKVTKLFVSDETFIRRKIMSHKKLCPKQKFENRFFLYEKLLWENEPQKLQKPHENVKKISSLKCLSFNF